MYLLPDAPVILWEEGKTGHASCVSRLSIDPMYGCRGLEVVGSLTCVHVQQSVNGIGDKH